MIATRAPSRDSAIKHASADLAELLATARGLGLSRSHTAHRRAMALHGMRDIHACSLGQ